jgi:hypothetical protein
MEKCKIYDTIVKEWHTQYFQFILDHPDKPWNWACLSGNPNITWEIVQKYPDKPWDWLELSENPNVATWEIVQNHPDKPWRWGGLSWNKMTVAREKYIQDQLFQRVTQWFIKSDLKRELMEKMWHPRNFKKWSKWGFEEIMEVEE